MKSYIVGVADISILHVLASSRNIIGAWDPRTNPCAASFLTRIQIVMLGACGPDVFAVTPAGGREFNQLSAAFRLLPAIENLNNPARDNPFR